MHAGYSFSLERPERMYSSRSARGLLSSRGARGVHFFRTLSRGRSGFTLIELLVVIALLVVLFTLVAAFGPGLNDRQKVSQSATQIQTWLLIAKQRAFRDHLPRGLRLGPTGADG